MTNIDDLSHEAPPIELFFNDLCSKNLDMTDFQLKNASKFAHILHRENGVQNLTRILGVDQFYDGHLQDVLQLFHVEHNLGWMIGPKVIDIGSGSGVPGLLAAAIDKDLNRKWILTESEQKKAEYLENAAEELSLSNCVVFSERVERVINDVSPETVIARAVGTIDKIASWIWECSTWNNIILFKSRGWADEWSEASKTRFGKKLTVASMHEYSSAEKYRVLINIKRK
jgi:16S rRNA (guanine(527)-N(7))-methyltransferase RsmG